LECGSTDSVGLRGTYARLMAAVEGSLPFIILADENGRVPERTKNAERVTPENGLKDAEWQVFAEGDEDCRGSQNQKRKENWPSHRFPPSLCGLGEDPRQGGTQHRRSAGALAAGSGGRFVPFRIANFEQGRLISVTHQLRQRAMASSEERWILVRTCKSFRAQLFRPVAATNRAALSGKASWFCAKRASTFPVLYKTHS
jgi:hypothetical protein